MKIDIYDQNSKSGSVEVNYLYTESESKLLNQVVVARLSHDRQGTVSTLTKSEVRGGGRKPWRQKGLGRARAGSIRSPLWKGGGVTFGPKPRDFSKKINKKQKLKAYQTVFSAFIKNEKLKVVKDFKFDEIKTKKFKEWADKNGLDMNVKNVVITSEYQKKLYLSSRNIQKVKVVYIDNIDILDLVYADSALITESAIKMIDERMGKIFNK